MKGWRIAHPRLGAGTVPQDLPLPLLMSHRVASAPQPRAPDPNHPWLNPNTQVPQKSLTAFKGVQLEVSKAQSRPVLAPRHQNVHASFLSVFSFCTEKGSNAYVAGEIPREQATEPRLHAGSPASMPAFSIGFKGIDILPRIIPIPSNQQDFVPQWKVSIRYLTTSSFSDLFASPKPLSTTHYLKALIIQ